MTIFKMKNGILQPKEEPKKPKRVVPQRAKQWNCPKCGYFYDTEVEPSREEATVGYIGMDGETYIPHIDCPECKECMACGQI